MLIKPFYGRQFFSPDGDGGGAGGGDAGNDDSGGGDDGGENDDSAADDAPLAIVQRERDAAKAEAKRVDKLLRDAQKRIADIDRDAQTRAEAAAKEQGNFKALYEGSQTAITERDARIVELEGQIAAAETATRRQTIAAKHKLTPELADRLRGDTDDELEADAKVLAKHVRTDAPDTEAGRGGRRQINETKPAVPGKTVDGQQKVAWTPA